MQFNDVVLFITVKIMMMKTKVFQLLLLFAFAVTAQSQVTLEIKHKEKATVATRNDIKTSQVLKLAGQDLISKNTQVIITEYDTGLRAADGILRTKAVIKKWTGKWEFPGGIMMEFDSEVPDRKAPAAQLEPVLDLVRVMLRNPVTHVFNKDGSVKGVEVPDDAVNSLPKEFKNELSPKKLGEELKQLHEILPDKAITRGYTWVRNQTANLGSGQMMVFRVDFKYDGIERKNGRELHHISGVVTDVEYSMDGKNQGPLKLRDSKLKAVKSSMDVLFDREIGRFVTVKFLVQIKGDMTFVANDMNLPAKLDLTMQQNTEYLPVSKK